jgi:malonate decarboxylase beta subunit
MTSAAPTLSPNFQELAARERLSALLDDGLCIELAGPFDRIRSPWLPQHGLVSQSDDGVVVVRGRVSGAEVVAIAIEPAFEGGSIGEVGGAKIAVALELAADSCRNGRTIAALLLLETGGVRLQEATLGLASIARIQTAILALRELAPVVAVIAGPTGCFGGMSLAAELCTTILGTSAGRLGMNGPEVIEQEAGRKELDASNREAIWQLIGCEARLRDGWIDAIVPDEPEAMATAVREALAKGVQKPSRLADATLRLQQLRHQSPQQNAAHSSSHQTSAVPSAIPSGCAP